MCRPDWCGVRGVTTMAKMDDARRTNGGAAFTHVFLLLLGTIELLRGSSLPPPFLRAPGTPACPWKYWRRVYGSLLSRPEAMTTNLADVRDSCYPLLLSWLKGILYAARAINCCCMPGKKNHRRRTKSSAHVEIKSVFGYNNAALSAS